MVGRLATRLVERYALGAKSVLDPFCGSGAILTAATRHGIPATGLDLNPMAIVLSSVKLRGFDAGLAQETALKWIGRARKVNHPLPVQWAAKNYWFSPKTLEKFERLRRAAHGLSLGHSDEGMAVVLAYLLSVRLCSRADQRSPKPFISAGAREMRAGRHFDPYSTILTLIDELAALHARGLGGSPLVRQYDVTRHTALLAALGKHSHVITSPPYINAQDYFRNFKLELYLLEGIAAFSVDALRDRFIGTDRGSLLDDVTEEAMAAHRGIVRGLRTVERANPRLGAVVHRYCYDMGIALDTIKACLHPNGKLILVCGDNLVAGVHIATWRVLHNLAEERGFRLFHRFSDEIGDRMLPPQRSGHRGLIKHEVVSAYGL